MDAPAATDVLRTPEAGARVIRGGTIRSLGYVAGVLIAAATSVILLRYLGVADFGRYATVAALLGIVSGVTDAGLIAVGNRELAVRPPAERAPILRNLVALRLLITPLGVAAAVAFTLAAGYDETLVYGTLLGGLGVLLVNTQSTMMLPLAVAIRQGAMTAFDVARHVLTLAGIALLAALGASLLPFFAVQIAVGLAILAATPSVVRAGAALFPAIDRATARMLVRQALPIAAALAMNVVYFRVLVVLTSLVESERETGLFGTSFRVFEVLFGLPLLVLGVALPVLSVAAAEDEERLRYALQRLSEVALAAVVPLVLLIVILAEPMIVLLFGGEYRDAAPVLQIQAFALVAVFVGQAWQLGLLALRQQAALVVANAGALALVVALGLLLVPPHGAQGAAVAAVIAEAVLALLVLAALWRARARVMPSFAFVPRLTLAGGLAAAVMLIPDLPPGAIALLAALVFAGVAAAVRAIPPELFAAFRRR